MNKIFVVMRREFLARVRTRAFIILTILFPIVMVAFSVLPALLSRGANRTTHVAIVDQTGDSLGANIEAAMASERLSQDSASLPRYQVERVVANATTAARVRDSLVGHTGVSKNPEMHSLDGVLLLSDSTLSTGKVEYLGTNTSAFETMGQLERTVSQTMIGQRLQRAGVSPSVMIGAMRPADMKTIKVSDGKETGQSGLTSFFVAYFMGFILYFAMIMYGQQTLTSVVEEKTSRIMEVLASSLRPFEMLLGKVIGVGSVGLLQLGIWGGSIFLVSSQRAWLGHLFGVSADAIQQFPIPSMPPGLLVIFLLYFVLGFLLYGAVYAAVGSMFNTTQDAQQASMFVQLVIMVGFFTLFAVLKDPTGSLAVTMSFVPFFSPFIMPARWSLTAVPPLELAISLSLSVVALLAVTWIAGRIYRTGILMYGKKPSMMEVVRWVKM